MTFRDELSKRTVGCLRIWCLVFCLVLVCDTPHAARFEEHFTGLTLRLDYRHIGDASREYIAIERLRQEGPWPGSRGRLLDRTDLGSYRFEIVDLDSQQPLYSRGFCSAYSEGHGARAGEKTLTSLAESIRFPEPQRPFQIRLSKRGPDLSFRETWTATLDTASRLVDRTSIPTQRVWTLFESGATTSKVDLLFLGDGYTESELPKFHADIGRLTDVLFSREPFAAHRKDFNVRAIDTPANSSGISAPDLGIARDSPLRTSYDGPDFPYRILTADDGAWREIAAAAPYDFAIILANSSRFGGTGIYQLYATTAAGSAFSDDSLLRSFARHFAGVADEVYAADDEPWEPNLTTSVDSLKWPQLVRAGTPVPTPWRKSEYVEMLRRFGDERSQLREQNVLHKVLDVHLRLEQDQASRLLGGEEHAGKVGAFESVGERATELYRPSVDCIMFRRGAVAFCHVCRRAIERAIRSHAR